jgi:hypothetical protein
MSDHSSVAGISRAMAHRALTLVACLSLLVLPGRSVVADSIMGTVDMTIPPGTGSGGLPSDVASTGYLGTGGLQSVNLGTIPLVLQIGGVSLGYNPAFTAVEISNPWNGLSNPNYPYNPNAQYNQTVNTTFDMKIAFGGASGSQPTVVLTGTLVGAYGGDAMTADMSGHFTATVTSATLENWSPSSGIPLSLLNQYLSPASYQITGGIAGSVMNDVYFTMTIDPSTGTLPVPAPEPATILVFLAMFAGLGVRGAVRARRANPAR